MFYIYHHTDADGYASAATVITYLLLSKRITSYNDSRIRLIPFNYENLDTFVPFNSDTDFNEGDSVFLVDLSVSTGTLTKFVLFLDLLFKHKCKFTWIDHHKSSIDDSYNSMLDKRFTAYSFTRYIDTYYCAAYNCYYYLINHLLGMSDIGIPEIIRVIDDYDCWKLKIDGSKELIVGMSLDNVHLPTNPDWFKWLTDRAECLNFIKSCIDKGKIINSWLEIDDTNKFNVTNFTTQLCGLNCCAVNNRRNSDIFRCKENYDVLLSYVYNGSYYKYSIYSTKDNVHCNAIAEMFGGGGHRGAAGFTTKKLIVTKKQSILYKFKDYIRKKHYLAKIQNIERSD